MCSFGFSFGDFCNLLKLAKNVYERFRDAPKQFRVLESSMGEVQDMLGSIVERLDALEGLENKRVRDWMESTVKYRNDELLKIEEFLKEHAKKGDPSAVNRWKWIRTRHHKELRRVLENAVKCLSFLNTSIGQ